MKQCASDDDSEQIKVEGKRV